MTAKAIPSRISIEPQRAPGRARSGVRSGRAFFHGRPPARWRRAGAGAVLAILSGCASPPVEPPTPEGSATSAEVAVGEIQAPLTPPAPAPAPAPRVEPTEVVPPPEPIVLAPFPGVKVRLDPPAVEVTAFVALDVGWLEQVACRPGTREHESLVVVPADASHVHAGLLLAGFEPGRPGSWRWEDEVVVFEPPEGSALAVGVRWTDEDGSVRAMPVTEWIRNRATGEAFPADIPWIFGGSVMITSREDPSAPPWYSADGSGAVVGLVTFGDETVGLSRVIADEEAVYPAEWEAWTERIPAPGTEVTLVLSAWTGGRR